MCPYNINTYITYWPGCRQTEQRKKKTRPSSTGSLVASLVCLFCFLMCILKFYWKILEPLKVPRDTYTEHKHKKKNKNYIDTNTNNAKVSNRRHSNPLHIEANNININNKRKKSHVLLVMVVSAEQEPLGDDRQHHHHQNAFNSTSPSLSLSMQSREPCWRSNMWHSIDHKINKYSPRFKHIQAWRWWC